MLLKRALVFMALCCAVHTPAAASPVTRGLDDFTVRTWNENDGLSVSRITAIAQDHDGYLWLGTDAGLVKFDGVRFLPVNDIGGVKLPLAPIPALLSTADRSLWIGTVGPYGIARLQNGRLTLYGADRGLLPGYVVTLLEDRAGVLWAGNASGLFTFDGDRWHAVTDPVLAGSRVLALHQSLDGSLWVASRTSVFRRKAGQSGFVLVDTFDIASNAWQGFSEDANGAVWISDFREGFRRVGVAPAPDTTHRGWGVQLLHDRRGNFWVATRGQGLWRVRPNQHDGQTVEFLTRQHGLATDAVQCLFEDREGNVWVGTQAGLQRLTPHRVTPLTDLPIARATALTPDGSVWVGSTSGLTRFTAAGRRHYGEAEGLPGSVVLATQVDRAGVLWVSTERGIARFANETFSPLAVPSGTVIPRIFSLVNTGAALWLRDVNSSIMKVSDRGEVLPLSEIPETFRHNVVTLADDAAGRLWFGGTNGHLGTLHPDGTFARRELPVGSITAITPAADGALWVGGDEGLTLIEGDRVRTVTAAHGLPTRVRSIVEDGDGVLWVGFGSGIARLEKAEMLRAVATPGYRIHYRLFNTADGAAGVPMTEGSRTAVRAHDDRLWFATSAGVTVIDPHQIGEPRHTAPAILEAVTAGARTIEPVPGVKLPARTSQLQFIFTAPTLTDSMRVEFKYRLDGVDGAWIDAGTNRQAAYANLGPGTVYLPRHGDQRRRGVEHAHRLCLQREPDLLSDPLVLRRLRAGPAAGGVCVLAPARAARPHAVRHGPGRADAHEPRHPRHAAAGARGAGAAARRSVAHVRGHADGEQRSRAPHAAPGGGVHPRSAPVDLGPPQPGAGTPLALTRPARGGRPRRRRSSGVARRLGQRGAAIVFAGRGAANPPDLPGGADQRRAAWLAAAHRRGARIRPQAGGRPRERRRSRLRSGAGRACDRALRRAQHARAGGPGARTPDDCLEARQRHARGSGRPRRLRGKLAPQFRPRWPGHGWRRPTCAAHTGVTSRCSAARCSPR